MAEYTKNQLEGMKIARQNERVLAKASRHARWNNDLKGYLAAQNAGNAGYMYRGIENVDNKNLRYFQEANRRRFYGNSGVGGQQPAGDTQRPAEGAQQPAGEQQQPPAEGRISSPTPSLVTSSGGGQLPAGGIQPPIGGIQPLGGGTQLPNVGTPKKPKSFFEERASGRQDFVDTIRNQRSGEEGVTDKFAEQAREQGAALGLTPEQIQATLDGETELSPEAISGRAKSKKDAAAKEAYQKEFGESDAKWAERIKDLPADQKAMLEGLTPKDKKDLIEKESTSSAEREQRLKDKLLLDKQERDVYDPLGDALDKLKTMSDSAVDFGKASTERTRKLLESVDLNQKTWDARIGMATSEYEAAKNKLPDKPKRNQPIRKETRPDHIYGQSLSGDFKQVAGATLEGTHAVLSGAGDALGGIASWTGDRVINAGNYIVNPEMRVPTRAEIRDFAESKGVSYEKGRDIFETERAKRNLKKKGMMPKESPQASINIEKIQGSYEKASRGADDILFGLSFDQRKV